MVNPWVMTGSSSAVLPFQQSSSTQRHPDRSTWRYISTEEFPANWPAAKQTPESMSQGKHGMWWASSTALLANKALESPRWHQGSLVWVGRRREDRKGQRGVEKGVVIVNDTYWLSAYWEPTTDLCNQQLVLKKKSTVWYNYFIRNKNSLQVMKGAQSSWVSQVSLGNT